MNKRARGNRAESLVASICVERWYLVLHRNRTIPWWEIDIIAQENNCIIFIEVKVVDHIDDLFEYITPTKRQYLQRSIECWIQEYHRKEEYRLDVVFVQEETIVERFENITNA